MVLYDIVGGGGKELSPPGMGGGRVLRAGHGGGVFENADVVICHVVCMYGEADADRFHLGRGPDFGQFWVIGHVRGDAVEGGVV